MTSGRIQSITPDWRSDTLAAAVDATDTVLSVKDTADFDELADDAARWLSIAGDAAVEYVDVDHDTNTITLNGPAGTAYEAGLPVQVWDPTVPGGGAPVVEYVATVMTDRGPVPSTVPHGLIPLTGPDFLVGASVTIDEEDGEWHVSTVDGREAVLDPNNIDTPYMIGSLLADTSIPNGTWTVLTGWFTFRRGFTVNFATPGRFYAERTGWYDQMIGVRYRSNGTGRRACLAHRYTILGEFDGFEDSRVAETSAGMSVFSVTPVFLKRGDSVDFRTYQNSLAALDVIGGETVCALTWKSGETL